MSSGPPGAPAGAPQQESPGSDARTFRNLAIALVVGVIVAAVVLFTADPGTGSISLGGAIIGLAVAVGVLSLVVLALLLQLNHIQTIVRVYYPGADAAAPPRPQHQNPSVRRVGHIDRADEAQHVLTLEGIGEKYATRLNNHGIITIPQLVRADAGEVAQAVDATPELVRQWQAMGRLVVVKGVGPQAAEMLALAGVRGARELAEADPAGLLKRIDAIEARRGTRVMGTNVEAGHVRRWIEAAQAHLR